MSNYTTVPFSALPEHCFVPAGMGRPNGTLTFPEQMTVVAMTQQLKIETLSTTPEQFEGIVLIVHASLDLHIHLLGSHQHFEFGENTNGIWLFRSWGNGAKVKVGKNVTSNGVDCFLNPNARLEIGDDCMFSMCHIHVGDSHGIFDIHTQEVLNTVDSPTVILREHVWVGLQASILPDSDIGAGSIVATKAVTIGAYPAYSLLAGIPAKIKRSGVSWSRHHNASDRAEVKAYLESLG